MPVTAPNRSGATPVTAPAIAEVASLDLVIVAAHVEFETIRLGKQHDGRAGQAGSVRQHRYCSRAVLPAGGFFLILLPFLQAEFEKDLLLCELPLSDFSVVIVLSYSHL